MYRSAELRRYQYYITTSWPGPFSRSSYSIQPLRRLAKGRGLRMDPYLYFLGVPKPDHDHFVLHPLVLPCALHRILMASLAQAAFTEAPALPVLGACHPLDTLQKF